jgi:hypothetical protein
MEMAGMDREFSMRICNYFSWGTAKDQRLVHPVLSQALQSSGRSLENYVAESLQKLATAEVSHT